MRNVLMFISALHNIVTFLQIVARSLLISKLAPGTPAIWVTPPLTPPTSPSQVWLVLVP